MRLSHALVMLAVVVGVVGLTLAQDTPRVRGLNGIVVKIADPNIVVKTMARPATDARPAVEAKEVAVVTDSKTAFTVDGETGKKLVDVKADMQVMVTPATGTAEKVVATSKGVNGVVVKVEGKNVVIKVRQGEGDPKEVTVVTDGQTKVIVGEKAGTLEDLKADMRVLVIPETGTAAKILVRVGGARRPAGGA